MSYINLLPWREKALKAQEKKYFTMLAIVGVVTFLFVLMVNFYYQAHVDGQKTKNEYLKEKIANLEFQIYEIETLDAKKTILQERISVVQGLQRSRNVGTQILNEIAKIIPSGIYITDLVKQGNTLQIYGKSESNNHLANIIRAFELSDLFVDATPESITADDGTSKLLSNFKMTVIIKGFDNESIGGK